MQTSKMEMQNTFDIMQQMDEMDDCDTDNCCDICSFQHNETSIALPCTHKFHFDCIWKNFYCEINFGGCKKYDNVENFYHFVIEKKKSSGACPYCRSIAKFTDVFPDLLAPQQEKSTNERFVIASGLALKRGIEISKVWELSGQFLVCFGKYKGSVCKIKKENKAKVTVTDEFINDTFAVNKNFVFLISKFMTNRKPKYMGVPWVMSVISDESIKKKYGLTQPTQGDLLNYEHDRSRII